MSTNPVLAQYPVEVQVILQTIQQREGDVKMARDLDAIVANPATWEVIRKELNIIATDLDARADVENHYKRINDAALRILGKPAVPPTTNPFVQRHDLQPVLDQRLIDAVKAGHDQEAFRLIQVMVPSTSEALCEAVKKGPYQDYAMIKMLIEKSPKDDRPIEIAIREEKLDPQVVGWLLKYYHLPHPKKLAELTELAYSKDSRDRRKYAYYDHLERIMQLHEMERLKEPFEKIIELYKKLKTPGNEADTKKLTEELNHLLEGTDKQLDFCRPRLHHYRGWGTWPYIVLRLSNRDELHHTCLEKIAGFLGRYYAHKGDTEALRRLFLDEDIDSRAWYTSLITDLFDSEFWNNNPTFVKTMLDGGVLEYRFSTNYSDGFIVDTFKEDDLMAGVKLKTVIPKFKLLLQGGLALNKQRMEELLADQYHHQFLQCILDKPVLDAALNDALVAYAIRCVTPNTHIRCLVFNGLGGNPVRIDLPNDRQRLALEEYNKALAIREQVLKEMNLSIGRMLLDDVRLPKELSRMVMDYNPFTLENIKKDYDLRKQLEAECWRRFRETEAKSNAAL